MRRRIQLFECVEQLSWFCRKFCLEGHEEAVAPVYVEIRRPGSRIVQPQ